MTQNPSVPLKTNKRYMALDILRGLTIALMILVNTPGDWGIRYAELRHAEWHGFTITDLVFPAFLFVIGNAMSFSMRKFETSPHHFFLKKIFSRFFKIFIIGLLLNLWPVLLREGFNLSWDNLVEVNLTGVLQRIAITYLLAAIILRYLKLKTVVFLAVIVLLGYWGILWFLGDSGMQYSLAGNAILKMDVWVFQMDTSGGRVPFDSEGLLSSLPATVHILFGYLAGKFIQHSGNSMGTIWKMGLAGFVFISIGQIWDIWFPINKSLWTSSYVLYSTGLILVILALLIWILELRGFKKWGRPFEAFGKNPLFIYIVSDALQELLYAIPVRDTVLQNLIYNNMFLSWLSDQKASMTFALCYVVLMWGLAYWMDKRNIYIKV